MEVSKNKAVALCKALGAKNPDKWDIEKLTVRLKKIPTRFKLSKSKTLESTRSVKLFKDIFEAYAAGDVISVIVKKKVSPKKGIRLLEFKNGVTRPADGTITASVWDYCDLLLKNNGGRIPPTRKIVLQEMVENQQLNFHVVNNHYARWKIFMGFKGYRWKTPDRFKKGEAIIANRT